MTKPEGTSTYCYTRPEVAAIVEHCRADPTLRWLADVVVGLACTGLRISELSSLRWSDVDPAANALRLTNERADSRPLQYGTIRTIKGRCGRALPLHSELRKVLADVPHHSDGRVFHGPRSGRLKPDTVRTTFIEHVLKLLKARFPTPAGEIGFEHGRIHSFRHYFCSEAFHGGASEAEVRDWLGHRDSKMVSHYRHLRDEDGQRRLAQIDFFGSAGSAVPPAK